MHFDVAINTKALQVVGLEAELFHLAMRSARLDGSLMVDVDCGNDEPLLPA